MTTPGPQPPGPPAGGAHAERPSAGGRAEVVADVLATAESASPVEAVEAVTRELVRTLGATGVSFLIADLSGRALVRLAHVSLLDAEGLPVTTPYATDERRALEESATSLPFDGGPAEQAVRTQQVQLVAPALESAAEAAGTWTALAPVTERGEVIGVLEVSLPERPDAASLEEIARVGHILAFVVIANRRHTDLYEWGQRTRPLSLSAEIQHRLLPGPLTCEAGSFTLAGWLEPSATIAGDTFDFDLARDLLHLSMTDAMGHGVAAALTATLCVSSLRNSRSQGATLAEQATLTNRALFEHATSTAVDDFVTGLVGRLDLHTGAMELVNAGHVPPYLSRGPDVTVLDLPVDVPLGLFAASTYRASRLQLQPGDRVVFVTDGMLERGAAQVDLPAAITATRHLHPREAVRALADDVLDSTGGTLSDDATVLCLDWHGSHGRDRGSVHGADRGRLSSR